MQIPVVVEAVGVGQFRAQGLPPFIAVAEGATSDEALTKLREQLHKEVEAGKRVVMLDVPGLPENPLLAMAGWLKDDPLFDEWRSEVDAYRRECDLAAGIVPDQRS